MAIHGGLPRYARSDGGEGLPRFRPCEEAWRRGNRSDGGEGLPRCCHCEEPWRRGNRSDGVFRHCEERSDAAFASCWLADGSSMASFRLQRGLVLANIWVLEHAPQQQADLAVDETHRVYLL